MVAPEKKNRVPFTTPEKWVDLYGNILYRFALSRLRNRQIAENAVQETFLAALTAHKGFSGKSSEKTWLIGILKHKIIDTWRQKYREVNETDIQTDEKTANSFFDITGNPKKFPSEWLADPREVSEKKEFWEIFEECLKKLPQATALAFSLREIDGTESKQICKVLKVTPTNLWVMLYRARLQLRYCLENNWFEKNDVRKNPPTLLS